MMTKKTGKKTVTLSLTEKQIGVLHQLHNDSGMGKSEIIGKFIMDYQDSIRKKICA